MPCFMSLIDKRKGGGGESSQADEHSGEAAREGGTWMEAGGCAGDDDASLRKLCSSLQEGQIVDLVLCVSSQPSLLSPMDDGGGVGGSNLIAVGGKQLCILKAPLMAAETAEAGIRRAFKLFRTRKHGHVGGARKLCFCQSWQMLSGPSLVRQENSSSFWELTFSFLLPPAWLATVKACIHRKVTQDDASMHVTDPPQSHRLRVPYTLQDSLFHVVCSPSFNSTPPL
ncbi:hypothetical protein B296_00026649 [Ensete ventricosum]|uniref:Uncharacterized protein n=1 Tax=Ensete ventricosum TaxID=4639 RepID=A0A426YM24_ENSVE|nr:hypothetical protein B296_00026649 [Ensete ventricosum]